MPVEIKKGNLSQVQHLLIEIPEFGQQVEADEFSERLNQTTHLILIAIDQGRPVGFKLGYDRYQDGSFYSWLGGVIPEFRRQGIARLLARYQEKWALAKGFKSIRIKTRNKFRAMLIFLLKSDFQINSFERADDISESRIELEKIL